jgi:N-acetylglucosaminyldiphosphoundecaprenol N-acetyl-beta-D-mannosaminyltransferase
MNSNQEKQVWHWFLQHVYKHGKKNLFQEMEGSFAVDGKRSLTAVCTPNPEQIMRAVRDSDFFNALKEFEVVVSDGIVTTLGAKFFFRQEKKYPEFSRITGVDIVENWLVSQQKKANGGQAVPTLLIGAYGNTAQRVARTYDPNAQWCFGTQGYSNIAEFLVTNQLVENSTQAEDEQLQALIQTKRPRVVFVAYGAPWQELWVQRYRSFLAKNGVRWVIVCGGALDVLGGNVARPPEIVRVLGMEWLFRLILEPWRWRRQLDIWRFLPFLWRRWQESKTQ